MKTSSVRLSEESVDNSARKCPNTLDVFSNTNEKRIDIQENAFVSSSEMVLMQTASTDVMNPSNYLQEATRIIFDSGSQRTYISQRLASKLQLKSEREEEIKLVTFGSDKPKTVKTSSANLCIKLNKGKCFDMVVNIVPVISGKVQRRKIDVSSMEHLRHFVKDVELADTIPTENESTSIELLVGNDYYLDLILSQRIEVQPGLYLLASKLGWIVTGRTQEVEIRSTETSMLILSNTSVMSISENTSIDSLIYSKPDLTDFWNLESIGITEHNENKGDSKAMKVFKETLQFTDGRYYVKWPWKEEQPELPVNRELALGRLKFCISCLRNKPEMMSQYNSAIQDQLSKGIIEEVKDNKVSELRHYIPHHAVVTPTKTTTKLRIVYDASAKINNEVKSLNECLYRGPVMLRNLCGMLMKFRLHRIALVADIERAFLQVGLQQSDRNVTRFFWLKDCENHRISMDNIREFRFCRVPFVIISSPFLLAATIESHLSSYKTHIGDQIKNDIYIDNLITGANTVVEAMTVYSELKQMFREASMNLREWISNSNAVNQFIPVEDKTSVNQANVLGHFWNIESDTLLVKGSHSFANLENTSTTKCKTLREIAEIFDPL